MAPVTWPGKILAGVLCLISVLFMAMPLSVPWIGTVARPGRPFDFFGGCWWFFDSLPRKPKNKTLGDP